MTFSRRPASLGRMNRRGIGTPTSGVAAMTPAALITGMQALNTWQLLCSADIGVSETTTPGRAAAWADQSGNGRNWATAGASNEPGYALDATLGRYVLSGDNTARYMTNAYNPPAPGTTPTYRVSLQRLNAWISGRTVLQASTNRYGIRGTGVPSRSDLLNGAGSSVLDYGERKWVIVEEYFSNSTGDFLRVGGNQVTGVNVGNTDPTSLGLFASNSGAVLGNYSVNFVAQGALPADRAAVRALLVAYANANSIKTSGHCPLISWIGDSQTVHDVSYSYAGYRKRIFDDFDTTANLFTRTCGNVANGSWATNDTRHDGVSGTTISAATTYLTGRYGSGGSIAGAGNIQLCITNLGAGDIFVGTAPATMLTNLEAFGTAWLTAETNSILAFTNLVPYPGDPADLATFNAGIPTVIANLRSAFGAGRVLDMIDINTPMGGVYDGSKYLTPGDRHLSQASSYGTVGAVISAAVAPTITTLAA